MLAQFWRSAASIPWDVSKWSSEDFFCCSDRDRKSAARVSGKAPILPAASPQEGSSTPSSARAGERPPREDEAADPALEQGSLEGRALPKEGRRRSEASHHKREGGVDPALGTLPSFYDQMNLGEKSDDSSDDDKKDDIEFDRELVATGYAMRTALEEERKRHANDGLDERIDLALHDLMPEVLEEDLMKENRVTTNAFAKPSMVKRRTAASSRRKRRTGAVDAGPSPRQTLPGEAEADVDAEQRYQDMKKLLWAERRVWGDPPSDSEDKKKSRRPGKGSTRQSPRESYFRDEIKNYQETVSERLERIGGQAGGSRQLRLQEGDDFTKVVKEGVMRYHQQCEAVGVFKTFSAVDAAEGSALTAESREKLREHVRCLRDDIPADQHPKDARATRSRPP